MAAWWPATTRSGGSSTIAAMPPYADGRSVTLMPCLWASRAATYRARRGLADGSNSGGAAHAGGEVVDAEQFFEVVRVGGAAFHRVEQRELAVQQGLAAPGDVEEHLVEAVPQRGLLDRRRDGGGLPPAERRAELAELVVFVVVAGGRRDGGHVDLLAGPQPGH